MTLVQGIARARATRRYSAKEVLRLMAIGDLVLHSGRRYRLLGIDPMSVTDRRADLEDLESGERVRVPLDEVETNDDDGASEQRF